MLLACVLTGALTITAALYYGELAPMMLRAGERSVQRVEALSRFRVVMWPGMAEERQPVSPVHTTARWAVSLSTAHLVVIAISVIPTWKPGFVLQERLI